MPIGVYTRTKKHKLALKVPHLRARKVANMKCLFCGKEFHVKPSWLKNRKFCSRECHYKSPEYRKNQAKIWLGRKHSEATKEKIRKLNIGIHKGEKSENWKGGRKIYWKRECLIRDNYTCQKCGNKDRRVLNVDHIKSKIIYPELQFDLKNGITLCANCHSIKTYYEDEELKKWKYDKR
jgi:5-methylcytosine-specific restriction endonuclease McrA